MSFLIGMVGQISMVGKSRSLGIFICLPKLREPMGDKINIFSHWNKTSKTDDLVIVSSFAFTPETKM